MRRVIVSVLILFLGNALFAQTNSLRLTPYQSLSYFVNNLADDNYHPDSASIVFYPKYVNPEKAIGYSIKLKQIIDGKGIFIDLEKVPNNPDFRDSLSNKNQYQIHI